MAGGKKLVMGATGFLGSRVTRQLVERGDDVRVILRPTSPTGATCAPRRAARFFRENRRRRR